MTAPPAETAAVRSAVRRSLAGVEVGRDGPVAAAVSGGADSLALAAGLAFERPGSYALVVDHGGQPDSERVAVRAAEQCSSLGLQARVLAAAPPAGAGPAAGGPEAAARSARYAALDGAVRRLGLSAVLLGHTLDDQAETVLLGLARGAGARSLAGMAAVRGAYRRPLLALERAEVRRACAQAGLDAWEDPHNRSLDYARVRVRRSVLPVLEAELGPGVAAALARTAAQLREDADALDELVPPASPTPEVAELAALPAALRSRALKRWAESGCAGAVTAAHVAALRVLVEDWRGQGPVALPGGVRAGRRDGRLHFLP
jgi:tRNA(Ile)-lysidine synthase